MAITPLTAAPRLPQQPERHTISGTVIDASGAPVLAASVSIESSGSAMTAIVSAGDGSFSIAGLQSGRVVIRASAAGFAEAIEILRLGSADMTGVRLVLHPSGLFESVSVTASRGARGLQDPASVSVVTSGQLTNSAAGAIDDVLRGTPGFSLFRRTSSRVANPTTQGVTLRGLSASGASRTLALADGQPLNDPFGSWIYWNRVPLAAIERIEVVRGAAGDLYGADALGGVIQILTFPPDRSRLRVSLDAASHGTVRGSLYLGGNRGGWTAAAAGEWLDSDGVPVVAGNERGVVDVPAFSRFATGFATIGRAAGNWHAELRAALQIETRGNGTPLQTNDTSWHQFAGTAAGVAGGGLWTASVGGGNQTYDQTFSAIGASRGTERLTSAQQIPTSFVTGLAQWVRPIGHHSLLIGAEAHRTRAEVRETRYSLTGVASGPFVTGGDEQTSSVFARVNLVPGSTVSINAGVRMDVWRPHSSDAGSQPNGSDFFSPRLSVAWRPKNSVAAHVMAYRAHRSPTLNELYRGFRVGNTMTNANPQLAPEHLAGIEGGLVLSRGPSSVRATGFVSRLWDGVTNVTIQSSPAQIVRERQNTDTIRAAGIEIEAGFRLGRSLSVTGLGVMTLSRFVRTPAQPDLAGNSIPQVPRYQVGGSITWVDPRVATVMIDARALGAQFEDDQNSLVLRPFMVVDVSATTRALAHGIRLFGAVENLFNRDYDTGRTPVRTVGWPRTIRLGVRLFPQAP